MAKAVVLLKGIPVELGKTRPKELEALGLTVDYKRAVQRTQPPYLLNCSVYYGTRQIAEIGFQSGWQKLEKKQIKNLPIMHVFLDVPSLGFNVNDVDFAKFSLPEAMRQLGKGAKCEPVRDEYTDITCRCGRHRIFLTYEDEKAPSCLSVSIPLSRLQAWFLPLE